MAQPSDYYRVHHDVSAPRIDLHTFRQGWRVLTRLDGLLIDGAIDEATYAAAIDFRRDWETGLEQRGSRLMSLHSGGSSQTDRMTARLGALRRLRAIAESLGALDCKLIEQCVVLDQRWTETARQHGVTDKTVRRWTIAALGRLGPGSGASVAPLDVG
jgi:hypothetical protein